MCYEVISVDDFLNKIKYGEWKNIIQPIRKEKDHKKRSQLKRSLPAVTFSGVFKERRQDLLLNHSGFICVDIDKFNDKTALLQDPYTYALFTSVSGNGIAVAVKINPEKHKESYEWLADYYFATYGIAVDPAPKNVASLRYVSYDPELYVNPKSRKSRTKSRKATKPKSLPVILPDSIVGEMVQEVVNLGINIAPDYESYLRLGFAIANGFGEGGRNFFHALCSTSEKYDSQQADKQYTRCLQGANKSGITQGTFYYMLQQAGIEIPKINKKAVQIAALAKRSGRTPEGVAHQLQELEGIPEADARKIAEQVFQRDDISLHGMTDDPEQLLTSLIEWMNLNHKLRYNLITCKIEENGTELTERRINTIYLRAVMAFNSNKITKSLVESIIGSDQIEEYNPITEFIEQNRWRNSSGNIDKLIETIETDTPNAKVYIRKWLIAIIAAYDGNVVRAVLVLIGIIQNTGKTEWFRRLLPGKLKKYYAESKLDAGKDDELLMCQNLICMDDEMGGKSKQDEKRFKELTSKAIFTLRAPYSRANQDYKRLAILCGTSNDHHIINDPTGNTRFLPINVLSINHELYNSIDKDELFMELVRCYESGEAWQLTKDELAELAAVSRDFETIPFERELIQKFFKPDDGSGYVEYLTSTEIKDYIEINTKQKIMNMRKFGIELRKSLGKQISKKENNIVKKVYPVIKISEPKIPENLSYYPQDVENDGVPF